ncbi:hypothetical protein [Sulfitobacter sp. TBRI5]|uniref:hypothetical protein n=1 Tax=Sulfitobacter sp. TBRI5 TaxID=2989732 RepID=UPI003D9B9EC7
MTGKWPNNDQPYEIGTKVPLLCSKKKPIRLHIRSALGLFSVELEGNGFAKSSINYIVTAILLPGGRHWRRCGRALVGNLRPVVGKAWVSASYREFRKGSVAGI